MNRIGKRDVINLVYECIVLFRSKANEFQVLSYVIREKLDIFITIIQGLKINKESVRDLFMDVVRKTKLEKRKRKTTEQELMEHDLPEAVLQMLG